MSVEPERPPNLVDHRGPFRAIAALSHQRVVTFALGPVASAKTFNGRAPTPRHRKRDQPQCHHLVATHPLRPRSQVCKDSILRGLNKPRAPRYLFNGLPKRGEWIDSDSMARQYAYENVNIDSLISKRLSPSPGIADWLALAKDVSKNKTLFCVRSLSSA